MTNLVLTFVLGALIFLDVFFAVRTIFQNISLHTLQYQAAQDQFELNNIQQTEALARDVSDFNNKKPNPELTRILQTAQAQQPTTTKKP